MTLQIPDEITIKPGVTYRVLMVNKIPYEKKGEHLNGYCDQATRTIWICKRQRRPGLEKTFIHELFHAIDFENNINLDHDAVYKLEMAFYKVLALNGLGIRKNQAQE